MRAFALIWGGQTISSIGSQMTAFALGLWLFERTGQATSLALVVLASAVPQLILTLLAGPIVDRFPRKRLMIGGDLAAAGVTLFYLALITGGAIPEWAIYLGAALLGTVDRVQKLAYDASITMLVPKRQYMRAGAMVTLTYYASDILAPASAAALYPVLGLAGILWMDFISYGVAIVATGITRIAQPPRTLAAPGQPLLRRVALDLLFGFRVIWACRPLRIFLLVNMLFMFSHDFAGVLYTPMILARTGNDAGVVAAWTVAMGVGGILMSVIVSTTGGPRNRMAAFGWSTLLAGVGKLLVGAGQSLRMWIPAQFFTSLNFPLRGSAWSAIWRSKIAAGEQGRVFAVTAALLQLTGMIGVALAGPLADRVLEPAMAPGGALAGALGPWLGTGPGAGMSAAIVLVAPIMIAAGVLALRLPVLRTLDGDLPDADAEVAPVLHLLPEDGPLPLIEASS
ncbi:MAG TPA: MFS transporter [Candidatus Limnocylindrales bacterium]|nr:MFS transporter [Candidatus Limnocylindrales bacterium]